MLTRRDLIVSLALVLFTVPASAGTLVYAINEFQFGTVDLENGAFHQIGPGLPVGGDGLAPGPNGSLLTLTFSGDLNSINPATGLTTVIGATGLGSCISPTPPCASNSANNFVRFGANFYATDLDNNLYTVNPLTAAATLLGPTGSRLFRLFFFLPIPMAVRISSMRLSLPRGDASTQPLTPSRLTSQPLRSRR